MCSKINFYSIFRQVALYFLFSTNLQVAARPGGPTTTRASGSASSNTPTPITSVTTANGQKITEVYTPTSLAISGLKPPITKATTVTTVITSDGTAQTVAIAIAAGAGVIGAGALAVWMFKPVPGAPPAPTSPPSYPTSSQTPEPPNSQSPNPITSTLETSEYACPFTQVNPSKDITQYSLDPTWAGPLPTLSTTSMMPSCTKQGSNSQLFRGTDPGYINALAGVFCKEDLTKDESSDLGQSNLPIGNSYKTSALDGIKVHFDFKLGVKLPGCSQNCLDAYSQTIKTCEYNSHTLYGGGSLVQGCGNYSFMIDAEPNTKLQCNPLDPRGQQFNYDYRDSAIQRVQDFCTSVDGKVIKQNDKTGWIEPASPNSDFFSIEYASNCVGSGTYKITKDYCTKYLTQTIDGCDTSTTMFKHGGTLTDTDNCGQFKFMPKNYDIQDCYPNNLNQGYITPGTHVQLTHDMAIDAINQFCSRSGGGQQYTLDPSNIPRGNSFVQDPCTTQGYASCGYFYRNDGSRVTQSGDLGDISVRMQAGYFAPSGFPCQSNAKYDIHGQRCIDELTKVVDGCNTNSVNQKDLGSFLESGDFGCVRWDMWAVATH